MKSSKPMKEAVQRLASAGTHFYYAEDDGSLFWHRVRHSEEYKEEIAEIMAEGRRLLETDMPDLTYTLFSLFAKTGSRLQYEQAYFERRRRLNTFALLSLLEPQSDAYHHEWLDAVWAVCSELTWCLPAHVNEQRPLSQTIDLFSAETGFTLAELTILLRDRLPGFLKTRMTELVHERLFRPFIDEGPYEWEEAEHNWSAVCAGSIGSAALLLLDGEHDQELLTQILEKTEHSMACYVKGFGEDGACPEGLGYWNYGFGYFVYYADLLYKRSCGELNWFSVDKVKAIAEFQQKCFLGGHAAVNFSDAHPYETVQLGLSRYLAGRFTGVHSPPSRLRAVYRKDHCSRWAPALRNLLWRNMAAATEDWAPDDFLLDNAQWIVSRTSSKEGVFGFAAKGGHNAEPHNHNDLGQFMIAGAGTYFLSDLGCGEYTKEYFGTGRYSYDCNGAQGHSVPIIDGCLQREGRQRSAVVMEQSVSDTEVRFAVELAEAYECPELMSFNRSWQWHKQDLPRLELKDIFLLSHKPDSLIERFVTMIKPQLYSSEARLLLIHKDLALNLTCDPSQFQLEVTERMYRDHFGKEQVFYTLDFHVLQPKPRMEVNLLFEFIKLDAGLHQE
ncbi:hypothetical protein [Paenibacillus lemnae]|nr:hypothetical protein [Paenibacillus lemnae]